MRDGAEAGARREVRRRSEEEGNSKAVISFWEFNKSEAFIFSLWIGESLFERPVKDYIIDWNLVERDSPSSQKMTHAAVSWQFITSPPHTAGRAVVNMQINEAAFLPASINTPSKQLLMRLQTASVCCVCVTVMQLLLFLSFFLFFWGGGCFVLYLIAWQRRNQTRNMWREPNRMQRAGQAQSCTAVNLSAFHVKTS